MTASISARSRRQDLNGRAASIATPAQSARHLRHEYHGAPGRPPPHRFAPNTIARRPSAGASAFTTYVAPRTMLRMDSVAQGIGPLACRTRPVRGPRFRSSRDERNIFRLALPSRWGSTTSRSGRQKCTSKPRRNSSRACMIALGCWIANLVSCRDQSRRSRSSRASTRPKYVAPAGSIPCNRRPHSTEGNIVLGAT